MNYFFYFQKDGSKKVCEKHPSRNDCFAFKDMDRGNGDTNESEKSIAGERDLLDESADERNKIELVVERKKYETDTGTLQTQGPNPTVFPEQDPSALLRRPHENLDLSSQPAPKNTTLTLPTSTADESSPLEPCVEFRPSLVDTVVPTQEMLSLEEVLPLPQDQQSFLQVNVIGLAVNTAEVYVDADVDAEADDDAESDDYTITPVQATDQCLPDVSPSSMCVHQCNWIHYAPLVAQPQVLVCGNQTDRRSSLSSLCTTSSAFVLVDAEINVDAEAFVSTTTPVQVINDCQPDLSSGTASAHQSRRIVCIPMVTLPQVLVCGNQTAFPPYQRSLLSPLCTTSSTFVSVLVQDETTATANTNTTQSDGGSGSENNLLPPLHTTSITSSSHSALQDLSTANAADSTESDNGNDGENNSLPPLHTTSSTCLDSVLPDLSTANAADSTESDDENDSENSSTDVCNTSQYANAEVNETHLDDDEPSIGSLGDFEEQTDSSEEASSGDEAADSRTQSTRKKNRKKHKTRKRS